MGYETVTALECDTVIALGGVDKKTRKANPTKIEGYFLGSKKVTSKMSKSGFDFIHVFQTPKGNIGVWNRGNMKSQLDVVDPGTMTLMTFKGMAPGKYGDTYKYTVQRDKDNTIDVGLIASSASEEVEAEEVEAQGLAEEDQEALLDDYEEEAELEDEEVEAAPAPTPISRAKGAASAPTQSSQDRVKALLGKTKTNGAAKRA